MSLKDRSSSAHRKPLVETHIRQGSENGDGASQQELEKLLEEARKDGKRIFEEEKAKVLSQIPFSVKNAFGMIGFVTWNKSRRPVLALNPYHVPPEPVRSQYLARLSTVSTHPQYVPCHDPRRCLLVRLMRFPALL